MRAVCSLSILALSASLCVAQASRESPRGESTLASSTSAGGVNLTCSISVQKPGCDPQHPVQVAILIQNRSQLDLNLRTVPSFVLTPLKPAQEPLKEEMSYLALWDLETGAPLPLSSTISLHLPPGDSKRAGSDIAALLWSRVNWSGLPHSRLFRVVPAGRYSLRLELTGNDGKTLCISNEVAIVIK